MNLLIVPQFFYSGVDVLSLLESLGLSEHLLKPLRESSAGYVALAFALYKLATPLRYAVTIGKNNIIQLFYVCYTNRKNKLFIQNNRVNLGQPTSYIYQIKEKASVVSYQVKELTYRRTL